MADSKSGSTTTALGPLLATPLPKTLVVILDGTWQDGMTLSNRAEATNCWRLARVIKNIGKVGQNVMVHYEAGVGAADWVPVRLRLSKDARRSALAGRTRLGWCAGHPRRVDWHVRRNASSTGRYRCARRGLSTKVKEGAPTCCHITRGLDLRQPTSRCASIGRLETRSSLWASRGEPVIAI
jgi:hypothetical protein